MKPTRHSTITALAGICVLFITLTAAACGTADDFNNGTSNNGTDPSRQALTENGEYYVVYAPTPDPIPFSQLFDMQVDVYETDAMDTRVDGAEVSVDATMPAHGHGMNTTPSVSANPDGGYLVEGMKFHMKSNSPDERWDITVDISKDGTSDTATFSVMCCSE